MYLSRIIISNFRSIDYIDINLSKGKNIIVGRNNSGKSNIIKAIDIVLSESSPSYAKTDNISEKDFFSWKEIDDKGLVSIENANEILIYCELKRDSDEELNWVEINKCFGYYKLVQNKRYNRGIQGYEHEENRIRKVELNKKEDLSEFANKIYELNVDDLDKRTQAVWIDGKLSNQIRFQTELSEIDIWGYLFRAKINEDNKIDKEVRCIYRKMKYLTGFCLSQLQLEMNYYRVQ